MRKEGDYNAIIRVKVVPRSSRNIISSEDKGIYKINLTAPPVEGKANAALKQLLSKRLGVPKAHVEIISGERSRAKSVSIHGLSFQDVNNLLEKDI